MKKIIIISIFLITAAIGMYSGEKPLPKVPEGSGVRGAANFIVATVDSMVILMSDIRREYAKMKFIYKRSGKKVPPINYETKKDLLKRVMDDIFFLIYAKSEQIEVTEAQVNKKLYDIKQQYGLENDEELVVATNRSRMMGRIENLNQLRFYFRRTMIINKAKSHLIGRRYRAKIKKPTKAELKKFYNNNPKYFYAEPKVKMQHLVIRVNSDAEFEEMEKLQSNLKEIIKKAKSGANFSNLVKKYASEAYKSNNGFISNQFLKKQELNSLFPKYVKYAFSLPKGGVSPVIIDGSKRIVLKVTDKKAKQVKPFEEVEEEIKRYILTARGKEKLKEWIEKQYRKRLINIEYDRLRVSK